MIGEILKKVESPFTDEFIKKLIEKYIDCGCDDELFYKEVNKVKEENKNINSSVEELISEIYSNGEEYRTVNIYNKEKKESQFMYKNNRAWMFLYSEDDPMKNDVRMPEGKKSLIYRIYLNLKGNEKVDFIKDYIKVCKEKNNPFQFKFSHDEIRDDQIILLSRSDNFEKNIYIINELIKGKNLGEIPMLVGKYKENIGIAEEYYNRYYSPTMAKLVLVRVSLKKYLCDHKDEVYELLSSDEKKQLDSFINCFEDEYKDQKEKKEHEGENYKDSDKQYYQKKSSIDCAKEYIENSNIAYIGENDLLDFGKTIKQVYLKNPIKFINENIKNYRLIGNEVWGFSKDFIFSNETEEKFINLNEIEQQEKITVIDEKLYKEKNTKELLSMKQNEYMKLLEGYNSKSIEKAFSFIKEKKNLLKENKEENNSDIELFDEEAKQIFELMSKYEEDIKQIFIDKKEYITHISNISPENMIGGKIFKSLNRLNYYETKRGDWVFASSEAINGSNPYIARNSNDGMILIDKNAYIFGGNNMEIQKDRDGKNIVCLKQPNYIYKINPEKFRPVVNLVKDKNDKPMFSFSDEWISDEEVDIRDLNQVLGVEKITNVTDVIKNYQVFCDINKTGEAMKILKSSNREEAIRKLVSSVKNGKLRYINRGS